MDNRQAKRRPLRGAGTLLFAQPSAAMAVRMLDISTMGAAFVTLSPVTVGVSGMLKCSVPEADGRTRRFETLIVVVDCVLSGAEGGFRIGARFEPGLHIDARFAVEAYVDQVRH